MGLGHHHHHHNHHEDDQNSDQKLWLAIAVNLLLTLVQVVGGILSGSLSIIADALHNLSDAATLAIALVAQKIGRKPADSYKTFGYKRAEVIAALINLTTLIIIGTFLIYEAILRFANPQPIAGWIVVAVATAALIVDLITAALTYAKAKTSMNMRAAFLHNLSDALASIAVIIAAILIILYDWYWVDTLLTLLIAGYILWQGCSLMPKAIHLLMEGTPEHIKIAEVISEMQTIRHVQNVHHVHIWQLDEQQNALEAHIVTDAQNLHDISFIKKELKSILAERFNISHSTLEFEQSSHEECDSC